MTAPQAGEGRSSVGSAKEMLDVAALRNVEFYEVSAKSNEAESDDESTDVAPQFELRLQRREHLFRVRLRVSFNASRGDVAVDAAAVYEVDESIEIPGSVGLEFANRVGIMALVPYLRESVHSITSKVFGEGLMMPIMKNGDLEFNQEELISHTGDQE